MTVLIKEVCIHCHRNICVGQSVIECFECDSIIHSKCYNFSAVDSTCENFYCNDCNHLSIKRYNPFNFDSNSNEIDIDDNLQKLSVTLENCRPYNAKDISEIKNDNFSVQNSMLFQNIDGNESNFDTPATELKRYEFEFSIIALAETNEGSEIKNLYQLTNYRNFYQEKFNYNKKKGDLFPFRKTIKNI